MSGRHASTLASAAFIAVVIGVTLPGGHWTIAIYALSFWQYPLYALAFVFGTVAHDVFKRDAVLMKGVSLAVLALAYFAAPPAPLSLAVIASGFLLNAIAARALGADRTYYGAEVAGLPPRRITAFPYSMVPHPMLLGNIAAFGGTLINPPFREDWWPLAAAHMALNLGLLVMEVAVTPRRGRPVAGTRPKRPALRVLAVCGSSALGTAFGGSAGLAAGGSAGYLIPALVGASAFAYGHALYHCYSTPISTPALKHEAKGEEPR